MSNLQDFLDFLGRPGAAARNVLKGNIAGAGRQLGQVPLDVIDAFLPGDVLPNITKPEDSPQFSDVLSAWGAPEMQPGLTKSAVDIAGGIVTDPLSFVPPAIIAKGGSAIGSGVMAGASGADALIESLTGAKPIIEPSLRSARNAIADTMNWSAMTPEQRASIGRVQGARAAQVQADEASQAGLLAGLSEPAQKVAVEAIQNQKVTPIPGSVGRADPIVPGAYEEGYWRSPTEWQQEVKRIAGSHPAVQSNAVNQAEVEAAIAKILAPGAAHGDVLFESKVFQAPALVTHPVTGGKPMPLLRAYDRAMKAGVLPAGSEPGDFLLLPGVSYVSPKGLSPHPYLARAYTDDLAAAGLVDPSMSSIANSAKERSTLADSILATNVNARSLITDADELLAQGNTFVAQGIAKQKVVEELTPYTIGSLDEEIAAMTKRRQELESTRPTQIVSQADIDLDNRVTSEVNAIDSSIKQSNDLRTKLRTNPRYLDSAVREATTKTIQAMKAGSDPAARDLAVRMEVLLGGMPRRAPVVDLLAKWSTTLFKKPATVGLGIINVPFMPRNRISAIAQAMAGSAQRNMNSMNPFSFLSDPSFLAAVDPKTAINDVRAVVDELVGAYAQAMNGKITPAAAGAARDATDQALRDLATAMQTSGGNSIEAVRTLRSMNPYAAEALENGVLGGFSSHDEMLSALSTDPAKAAERWKAFLDAPAKGNEALENRMRMNFFIAQRKAGLSPEQAAQSVRTDLLDYTQATPQNRIFRDIVPFGAFLSQSIPQALQSPLMISAAGQLLGNQPDEPLMPNMVDKINVPLGFDAQGNAKYLTSLGLPVESLGQIPTSQEDALSKLAGISHPIIRTGIGFLTGEDPVFGSPFGSYDKTPLPFQALGAEPNSELGRVWALLNQTGLTTFASPIMRPAQTILDERLTPEEKAARLFTGARIQSVDPVRAEQATIKEALKWNPDIQRSVNYYTTGGDPETIQMLEEFKAASKALREKIKAEKEAAAL